MITVNTPALGSDSPYVREGASANSFVLKFTEVNASLQSIGLVENVESLVINSVVPRTSTDKYGRKYTWYSAIDFNATEGIIDPGVLIYSNVQEDITITSEIVDAVWSDTG